MLFIVYIRITSHECHGSSNNWWIKCLFKWLFWLTAKSNRKLKGPSPKWGESNTDMAIQLIKKCSKVCFACYHNPGLGTINTLRPRQNGRHFTDDIFEYIFLNENVWILIKISLKCIPSVWIINIPAWLQIMVWHQSGHKPLSEPMMVRLPMHICITRPQWVKASCMDFSISDNFGFLGV